MKICLDAGHSIKTAGKRTPLFEDGTFIHEAEQNYPVMFELKKLLEQQGIEVVVTNKDINYDMNLRDRVLIANDSNADYFISIHSNAITGKWQPYARGIETYVHKKGYTANKLADAVQSSLLKDTKMKDRGVKEWAGLYVTKHTKMPAILVELGFMDYKKEALQMKNVEWHKRYAKAILKGVLDHLNIKAKETTKAVANSNLQAQIDKLNKKLSEIKKILEDK